MPTHEFEDLVTASIRCLSASVDKELLDLRSLFWYLYDFQNHWDTGFTRFRVMDLLLASRFTYRFDRSEHPDYDQNSAWFNNLTGFAFIRARLTEPAGNSVFTPEAGWQSDNPAVGYFKAPYLYCDAGSPLWKRLVDLGKLTGLDAAAPNPKLTIINAADATVTEAELQRDFALITAWYSLLSAHLVGFTSDLGALADNPALEHFLKVVEHSDAIAQAIAQDSAISSRFFLPPVATTIPTYLDVLRELKRTQSNTSP